MRILIPDISENGTIAPETGKLEFLRHFVGNLHIRGRMGRMEAI